MQNGNKDINVTASLHMEDGSCAHGGRELKEGAHERMCLSHTKTLACAIYHSQLHEKM